MTRINSGWLKLHRSLLDSVVWKSINYSRVWTWCLMKAEFKKTTFSVSVGKSQIIGRLEPGQFITGRESGSAETQVPSGSFYRALQFLQKEGMIDIKPNSHFSIITICKWEEYQGVENPREQHVNNTRTTGEQHVDTSKEYKEEEEREIDKSISGKNDGSSELLPPPPPPPVKTWRNSLELYQESAKEGFRSASKDEAWMSHLEDLYPKLDVKKTMQNMYETFWSTEAAWLHRKKSKSVNLNWKATIQSGFGIKSNQIYKS